MLKGKRKKFILLGSSTITLTSPPSIIHCMQSFTLTTLTAAHRIPKKETRNKDIQKNYPHAPIMWYDAFVVECRELRRPAPGRQIHAASLPNISCIRPLETDSLSTAVRFPFSSLCPHTHAHTHTLHSCSVSISLPVSRSYTHTHTHTSPPIPSRTSSVSRDAHTNRTTDTEAQDEHIHFQRFQVTRRR